MQHLMQTTASVLDALTTNELRDDIRDPHQQHHRDSIQEPAEQMDERWSPVVVLVNLW